MRSRVGMLQTPVIAVTKNGKLQRWIYSLDDNVEVKNNERVDYKKGLGSWDPEDLKYVVDTEGLDSMITLVNFNSIGSMDIMEEWLGEDSTPRKKYIINNKFTIAQA